MELTQDDVPICRILFNKDTHPMAIAMYGDRAREIYRFVCNKFLGGDFFEYRKGHVFYLLLCSKLTASFFFDNNLVNFEHFDCYEISWVLCESPIAEKIWDSGILDQYLDKVYGFNIYKILTESPICDKIWDSGKLGSYFHKMDDDDISWLLRESPIADKIKASGKIKQKKE